MADTRLAIYEGAALAGLVLDERNDDDALGEPRSRIVVDAVAGRTYRIQLGDAPGQTAGERILRWYQSPPDPPELCPADPSNFLANPSLEADAAGWAPTSASSEAGDFFQRYLGDGAGGAACAEILIGAAAAGRGLVYADTNPHDWSGRSTISIWLKCAGGTPSGLLFHASVAGTPLVLIAGAAPVFALSGAWQQISLLYDALPGVTGPLTFSVETDGSTPAVSLVLRADCLKAQTTLEPPATPTNLACAPSQDAIRLSWTASAGADGYYVRLDGSLVATVTTTEVVITGLVPGTSHDLAVSAFSTSRGESLAATISCSTLPVAAQVAPDLPCGALCFLEVDGVEVLNAARTIGYLRRGLGRVWEVQGEPCDILTREIGFEPTSPAIDPAPWYDSTRPESVEFLGALMRLAVVPATDRSVTQRISGLGGASFGPQRAAATEVHATGTLFASTSGGMNYGRRWIESILRASGCDPCGLGVARIRLACPPLDASDDTRGEYLLYDMALTSGVKDDESGPGWQDVEFVLSAGNPLLYQRTQLCASGTLNPDPGVCVALCDWLIGPDDGSFASSISCAITSPPLFGTNAAIVTISADVATVTGVELLIYGPGTPCPPPAATLPLARITVPQLAAGEVLVIDSARQTLTHYPTTSDAVAGTNGTNGAPYIVLEDGKSMSWVQAEPCAPAGCVVVGKRTLCGGQASVRIDTQLREA